MASCRYPCSERGVEGNLKHSGPGMFINNNNGEHTKDPARANQSWRIQRVLGNGDWGSNDWLRGYYEGSPPAARGEVWKRKGLRTSPRGPLPKAVGLPRREKPWNVSFGDVEIDLTDFVLPGQ